MAVRAKISSDISQVVGSWVVGGESRAKAKGADAESSASALLSAKLPRGGIGSNRLTEAGKRGRDESEAAGQAGAGEESILAKRLRYDEKRQQRRAVEAGEDDEPEGPEAAPGGAAGSTPQGMELPAGAVADAAALGVEREDEDEDDDEDSENESDRVVGGRSGAVGNTRAGARRGGPARNQSAVAGFAATASSASAAAAAAPGSGGVPVEQLSKKARKKRRKQAAAARAGAQSGGPPPVAREPAKTVPATGMGGML